MFVVEEAEEEDEREEDGTVCSEGFEEVDHSGVREFEGGGQDGHVEVDRVGWVD